MLSLNSSSRKLVLIALMTFIGALFPSTTLARIVSGPGWSCILSEVVTDGVRHDTSFCWPTGPGTDSGSSSGSSVDGSSGSDSSGNLDTVIGDKVQLAALGKV